jgi:methionine aminotransferase
VTTTPSAAVAARSKLPRVGTTIFTVMSALATEVGAVNLGQGFPDFPVPEPLVDALASAMRDGKNQYAPSNGILPLREAIAAKTAATYGYRPHVEHEITVTSGASEAIFDAVQATVRAGDEVITLDPSYDLYEPAIILAGGSACACRSDLAISPWTGIGSPPPSRRARG